MQDLGNRVSILCGSSATWQYGPSGELTDVRNASFTGATISRYAYTYDAALRRIAVAKSGRAFATEDDISYGYNYRSELTNATAQADSAYRYAYDFDDIGNRKTSAERTAPSVSYTANSLNQYTAIDDFVPTYDADGNQTLVKTKTGIWHVTYNGENRPVRWESGTNVITMVYDRMGRRISKNDQTFIYDGYLQIADNRGSSYIWDPTEPVATRPLVRNNSEFYFHDGNKNVSDILSVTGSLLSHYDYAPFGDCTSVGSNPWRFSSEYSDDDLGLIYYNYRHYDVCAGRWMRRDPAEEFFVREYGFCANNPILYYDSTGTFFPVLIPIGVAIAEEIAQVALAAAIATTVIATTKLISDILIRSRCPEQECLPCVPPVGTIGFRTDVVPLSKPHYPHKGTHTHLYIVNQSPVTKGCKCFWSPTKSIEGDVPSRGAVPMNGHPAGGGVAFK